MTREYIQHTWKLHFETEILVERMRADLLKNPGFDIGKAYKDLDQEDKGFFTAEDVGRYLSADGLDISTSQQERIFQRFNKRLHPERVGYVEFIEEITPRHWKELDSYFTKE